MARRLSDKRFGAITTEIRNAPEFYFAEDYHQQYLAKNPMGYCGLGGTGVSLPDRDGRRGGVIAVADAIDFVRHARALCRASTA